MECVGIRACARRVLLCSKSPRLRSQPGNMTTPWKYTGQSVPRGKQHAGTAAPEHPARGRRSPASELSVLERAGNAVTSVPACSSTRAMRRRPAASKDKRKCSQVFAFHSRRFIHPSQHNTPRRVRAVPRNRFPEPNCNAVTRFRSRRCTTAQQFPCRFESRLGKRAPAPRTVSHRA